MACEGDKGMKKCCSVLDFLTLFTRSTSQLIKQGCLRPIGVASPESKKKVENLNNKNIS